MQLNDLFFFVQVVDDGGFAAASRRLGTPKSSLSKRVATLERDLGARLIHRTTRSFVVTDVGMDFYRHAKAALIEAEAAEDAVKLHLKEPRGRIRISASPATVQIALADILSDLTQAFTKIQIDLVATNEYLDLVAQNIDIAIRAHRQPLADSGYVQRQLGFAPNYLVASPAYLGRHGEPESPEDLVEHFGLFPDGKFPHWKLISQEGQELPATPTPRMITNDAFASLRTALSGQVIANLPHGLCWNYLEAGQLRRVLPDWQTDGAMTSILMPHRRGQLPAVRAALDFMVRGLNARMGYR